MMAPFTSPDYWRMRAASARETAEKLSTEGGRYTMRRLAESYDRFAQRAEAFRKALARHGQGSPDQSSNPQN
jgi:hypothetical protein